MVICLAAVRAFACLFSLSMLKYYQTRMHMHIVTRPIEVLLLENTHTHKYLHVLKSFVAFNQKYLIKKKTSRQREREILDNRRDEEMQNIYYQLK